MLFRSVAYNFSPREFRPAFKEGKGDGPLVANDRETEGASTAKRLSSFLTPAGVSFGRFRLCWCTTNNPWDLFSHVRGGLSAAGTTHFPGRAGREPSVEES